MLRHALEHTGSSGGGLFIFDLAADRPQPIASAFVGKPADDTAWEDGKWPDAAAAALDQRSPLRIDDHSKPHNPAPLQPGSLSSAWIPLIEGKRRLAGFLQVASKARRHYSDRHLEALTTLAESALPAIHRVILRDRLNEAGAALDVIGVSPAFLALERQVRVSAGYSDGPVMITGERGSGKELTAWAVHCWSRRWDHPFVPALASAFAEGLMADELFGHERSSFTGASHERPGRFAAADGGSLFLDEVGDLSAPVQSLLMRVIDRGELSRIGRDVPIKVDVRVIAATNRDFERLMDDGAFRRDLYDRLRIFEIHVPPLRSRPEDVALLVSHFLKRHCERGSRQHLLEGEGVCARCERGRAATCVSREALGALQAYPWPGNVRELSNLVARLCATVPDEVIELHHLPEPIRAYAGDPGPAAPDPGDQDLTLDGVVRRHLARVLAQSGYNQTRAAELLGLPLSTMRNKMKKLGVRIPRN